MRPFSKLWIILVCFFVLSACEKKQGAVWEGPFGLKEGLLFSDYNKDYKTTEDNVEKMIYETYEVPKPDERFMHYQLAFDPDAGLCKIVAHGRKINTSPDGAEIKAAYQDIVNSLEKAYGPMIDQYDFVDPESEHYVPDQWMDALLARERILGGYWKSGDRSREAKGQVLQLPYGLTKVVVGARAFNRDTGSVTVEYEFSNYEQCKLTARMRGNGLQ